jgi:hypothetical protein
MKSFKTGDLVRVSHFHRAPDEKLLATVLGQPLTSGFPRGYVYTVLLHSLKIVVLVGVSLIKSCSKDK